MSGSSNIDDAAQGFYGPQRNINDAKRDFYCENEGGIDAGASTLAELSDVSVSGALDGEIARFNTNGELVNVVGGVIKGTVPTHSSLPAGATDRDLYLVEGWEIGFAPGVYMRMAGDWILVSQTEKASMWLDVGYDQNAANFNKLSIVGTQRSAVGDLQTFNDAHIRVARSGMYRVIHRDHVTRTTTVGDRWHRFEIGTQLLSGAFTENNNRVEIDTRDYYWRRNVPYYKETSCDIFVEAGHGIHVYHRMQTTGNFVASGISAGASIQVIEL